MLASLQFADGVDDIAVEFSNSLCQKAVDRDIGGEKMPLKNESRRA
jgi:hypothetical protein